MLIVGRKFWLLGDLQGQSIPAPVEGPTLTAVKNLVPNMTAAKDLSPRITELEVTASDGDDLSPELTAVKDLKPDVEAVKDLRPRITSVEEE